MKAKTLLLIITLLSCVFLCSCMDNPRRSVVVSKNDGSFDISSIKEENGETNRIYETISSTDTVFYSTDGSVKYSISFDLESACPVMAF